MMMSGHTEGPWRLGADLCRVHTNWHNGNDFHRNGFAKTIATVIRDCDKDWRGIDQAVADGYLVAAAPDLLALAYQYANDLRYPPSEDSKVRRLEAINAAIARATGRSPTPPLEG